MANKLRGVAVECSAAQRGAGWVAYPDGSLEKIAPSSPSEGPENTEHGRKQTQSEIKARTEGRKYIAYERHDEMFADDNRVV